MARYCIASLCLAAACALAALGPASRPARPLHVLQRPRSLRRRRTAPPSTTRNAPRAANATRKPVPPPLLHGRERPLQGRQRWPRATQPRAGARRHPVPRQPRTRPPRREPAALEQRSRPRRPGAHREHGLRQLLRTRRPPRRNAARRMRRDRLHLQLALGFEVGENIGWGSLWLGTPRSSSPPGWPRRTPRQHPRPPLPRHRHRRLAAPRRARPRAARRHLHQDFGVIVAG